MAPKPKAVSEGSMNMTVRELLMHMLDRELNHAVLEIPSVDVQISITIANKPETAEITKQVERILK